MCAIRCTHQCFENHKRGYQDFLVKMTDNPYREFVSVQGPSYVYMHYFSLMMYRFCRNNALYTTSLSLTMYILLLNPFNEIVIISRTKHKDSKIQNIKK